MKNRERLYALAATDAAVTGIVLIFLPAIIGLDGMDGGYAVSFVAFFIAVGAAVAAVMFWRRALAVDRLMAGDGLLAHWSYSEEEWRRFAMAELGTERGEKVALAAVVAGWALFFGLLFWLVDPEAGGLVLLMMIGLALLCLAVAYFTPARWLRKARGAPGEAWIGTRGVLLGGAYVPWAGTTERLQGVALHSAEGDAPECLALEVRTLNRTGWQPYTVRVPVPEGRGEEARALVESLSAAGREKGRP